MVEPSAGPIFWELLGDFLSMPLIRTKDTMVMPATATTDKAIVLRFLLLVVSMELLLSSPAMVKKSCQVTTFLLHLLLTLVWLLQV